MASQAVIYYTHFVSETVKREITGLGRELGPDYSLFAVGCCPEKSTLDELADDAVQVRAYVREELRELPYERQLAGVNWDTMRRSPDLCLMRFFRGNPDFDHYWIIEYDVRFSGSWKTLFAELSKSDAELLCVYATTLKQGRGWMHWDSFSAAGEAIDEDDIVRAFLPFCRVSGRVMRAIDDRCRRGWTGHPEVLWPTIARSIGARIEDIGGTGPAVPDSRRGRYYHATIMPSGLFLSTFGAWPVYSEKSAFRHSAIRDILWHPVKE